MALEDYEKGMLDAAIPYICAEHHDNIRAEMDRGEWGQFTTDFSGSVNGAHDKDHQFLYHYGISTEHRGLVDDQLSHVEKMKAIAQTMVHERLHHENPNYFPLDHDQILAAAKACAGT